MTCQCRTEKKLGPLPDIALIAELSKFLARLRYLESANIQFKTDPGAEEGRSFEYEAVVSYVDDFPEY